MMKRHRRFELFVGEYLRSQGYTNVIVTQGASDGGVDAFCEKDGIKFVVQDKMYGECKTKVNRNQLFELCGAMHYNDCQGAIMIYNGKTVGDLATVAKKLGIHLLFLDQKLMDEPIPDTERPDSEFYFNDVWDEIRKLVDKTIENCYGTSYHIVNVTDSGISFVNQKKNKVHVAADCFYRIANYISLYGSIRQTQIRENTNNCRQSAFIATILANIPFYEVVDKNPITIRLRGLH